MENFVPYKLAVKLEQKGFKQGYNIFGFRPIFSNETTIRFISNIGAYQNEYFGENIAAPTISQVLTWLRKEKKIHIAITITQDNNERFGGWDCIIVDFSSKNHRYIFDACRYKNENRSYELAALAGIEYILDNLI